MDVFITRPLPEPVIERAQRLFNVTLRGSSLPMSHQEMCQSLTDYDAVLPTLGDLYRQEIFDAVPKIRAGVLANFGVGFNHIDVAAATSRGVKVSNTPGAVTDATADTAMTLILSTARRAGEGERLLRAGNWTGWHPTQLLGTHVTGKTVGIIGMGRIGTAIAQRCHFGFGMKVVFYNRSPKELPFPAQQLEHLHDVARACDFLVVATPGDAKTHHLIDEAVFEAMSPQTFLINIARGNVVKESALITALNSKSIAGAGLDVYEFEPQVPKALIDMQNVTLLPHLGTATQDVRTAMGMMALDNLERFCAGKDLLNPV